MKKDGTMWLDTPFYGARGSLLSAAGGGSACIQRHALATRLTKLVMAPRIRMSESS